MAKKFLVERCRALKASRALSSRALADALAVSCGYLSEVENGKRQPSLKIVHRMAEFFAVSPESFFDGYDDDPVLLRCEQIVKQLPDHYRAVALAVLSTLLEKHRRGDLLEEVLEAASSKRVKAKTSHRGAIQGPG